jgi:hypothetical protein
MYVAAVVGGLMIFAAERLSRREPSESDVKRAADRYPQSYGETARAVISDHMVAASFAPDTRYRKFPGCVAEELRRRSVDDEDRRAAIDG